MTKTIGIIGSGNIGRGLAKHLSTTSFNVLIANSRGPESLESIINDIGGSLSAVSVSEAVAQSDVLFIAVPWTSLKDVSKEIALASNKIIIDATNNIVSVSPFRVDDLKGKSTGEVTASYLPGHRIVKGFNTLGAGILSQSPKTTEGTKVIMISGDDIQAKDEVQTIIAAMGFSAIDLGSLRDGGKMQDVGGAFSGLTLILAGR